MRENELPQARETAIAQRPQSNARRRILVVDDDYHVRELNALVLTRSGYEVNTAPDGAAAWAALNGGCYDLLVTNYLMPNVSGIELLMRLHAARMTLPVIMASGDLPQEQFSRYPWLKPAAMLLDPYNVGELLKTVNQVLYATNASRERVVAAPSAPSLPVGQWFAAILMLLRGSVFP